MGTRFEQTRKIVQIILHPDYFGEIENGVLVRPPDYDIGELKTFPWIAQKHSDTAILNLISLSNLRKPIAP